MAVEEVVQTPFGAFLVTRGELIGETTRAGTLWDGPGFLEVIAKEHGRLGEAGVTILDVGANQGAFAIWLATRGAWRVVAVEPVPQVMQRLKANLDLNRQFTSDVVIPLEVAGYNHLAFLTAPTFDAGNWGGTALQMEPSGWIGPTQQPVRATPLDQYWYLWQSGLSLIKIDAQGCDGAVIFGLLQTLATHRPVVVFEWEAGLAQPHGITLEEVLLHFKAISYTVHEWPTHKNNYLALPGTQESR